MGKHRLRVLFLVLLATVSLIVDTAQAVPLKDQNADPALNRALKKIDVMITNHDYDGALPLIDTLIKQYPQSVDARIMRGDVYTGLEEDEKALNDYLWAKSRRPTDARLRISLGDTYFVENKIAQALAENEEALKLCSSSGEKYIAWDRKREYLKHSGRNEEAEKAADKMLEYMPGHPHSLLERAKLRLLNKHWQGAIEDTTFCLPAMPQFYCRLLQMRSQAYVGLGQFDKAIADLKKAVASQPEERLLHVSLKDTYQKAGKSALAAHEEAIIKSIDERIHP